MTLSMYEASIPRFIHTLDNLAKILDKAQAYAEARKIDPTVLASDRLYPDMLPLSAQVQIATDSAKGVAARLAGIDIPVFEDNEKTLTDLKARVEKTIAFLRTLKAAQVDGTEDKSLVIKVGGKDTPFTGIQLLLGRSLPNFYFHVTMAYAILRHNGLDIGKRDYLG
ncbi:MAG: DUF1993 domain-containing protein [Proteobacteria bacterium]|nr:DUF1993 domain-containing protein [Pseudomonadota bacterium]